MIDFSCQVAVIGAGPSGLAVATELAKSGIDDIHIFERESTSGGIPRHCSHSPFGFREFKRILTGKKYAQRLTKAALDAGAVFHLNTTVISICNEMNLTLSSDLGLAKCKAGVIIICTGARETPRPPRFISGDRPLGILTTGALQSLIAFKGQIPFKKPIIVGNELVTFSAMLTCKLAGIQPVGIVNDEVNLRTRPIMRWSTNFLGIDYLSNTKLLSINGANRVQSVEVQKAGAKPHTVDCDGVIFTGKFTAENSLARSAGLTIDQSSSSPQVDQYNRSSNSDIYVLGNQLHPVDTAGWCWQHAKHSAHFIANHIQGLTSKNPELSTKIKLNSAVIKYVTPQVLSQMSTFANSDIILHIRFQNPVKGNLVISQNGKTLNSKYLNARPEKRYLITLDQNLIEFKNDCISIDFYPLH